jgi:uncharacterized protein (TIGR02246 family)
MKRKILAVLTVGLLLGAGAPGDGQAVDDVKKAIGALNEAFEKGDAAAVKKLMTDDHVAVTPHGGAQKRDEQVASLPDLKLTEYSPGAMRVTVLGRDAALVTYPLSMKGTYKGRPLPPRSFASAVWVRRDGRWLESFYQETPLEGK